MAGLITRVLAVDDYEPWHNFYKTVLRKQPNLHVIGHVSDGLEAVQQAQKLRPDLILLDIGLPTLNGIEAARRIRDVSPASEILFVSENRSPDIVEATWNIGAGGYVVKSDAARELLTAISAVLEGKRFTSASLSGDLFVSSKPEAALAAGSTDYNPYL
jgi:DNA-binding NarL/FixJ family response regulator